MIPGKKINLRLVEEADLEEVTRYFGDVKGRGHENVHLMHGVTIQRGFQENGYWGENDGVLHIVDKKNNVVGFIQFAVPFTSKTRNALETSYGIFRSENWGKGYASEAISLFVPFLFETRTEGRIQACTSTENIGSQRVLEKNGFTFEGVLRKVYLHRGKRADARLYSILREESKLLEEVMA
jgi:RimJ/RimL family protein N-acetyltransferase